VLRRSRGSHHKNEDVRGALKTVDYTQAVEGSLGRQDGGRGERKESKSGKSR